MTESAYLKHHVGEVLAKGVAATAIARPSNPQEYLGLWLLHYLQQQDRAKQEAERMHSIELQKQQMDVQQRVRETKAVQIIEMFWARALRKLRKAVRERARLLAALENAKTEAQEEFPSDEDEDGESGEGGSDDENGAGEQGEASEGTNPAVLKATANKLKSKCAAARTQFQRSQFALQKLTVANIGEIKHLLAEKFVQDNALIQESSVCDLLLVLTATRKDRFSGPAITLSEKTTKSSSLVKASPMLDRFVDKKSLQLLDAAITSHYGTRVAGDADFGPANTLPGAGSPAPLVPPANPTYLAQRLAATVGDRAPVNMPLLMYRVVRSLCYLLLNATPRQTSTPTLVQNIIKPFHFLKQLHSFSPVSTYYTTGKVRRGVQGDGHGGDDNEEEGDEDDNKENGAAGQNDAEEQLIAQLPPNAQPKRRQVTRCARKLRLILANNDYITPEALRGQRKNVFSILEQIETENQHNDGSAGDDSNMRAELAGNAAAFSDSESERELLLSSYVEEYVKQKNVVLWSLLVYLRTATEFRRSRDAYVAYLQQHASEAPELEQKLATFMEKGLGSGESGNNGGGGGAQQSGGKNAIRENEMPEEESLEAGDEMEPWQVQSEENEGEIDADAVFAMKERFGTDQDEAAVMLWEAVEQQQTAVFHEAHENLRHTLAANKEKDNQGENGNGGNDDDDNDDDE